MALVFEFSEGKKMIVMLMIFYLIFIIIGIRKNKKNIKQYKKKKYFSIITLGIVNAMLISHDFGYSYTDLFFYILIAISLGALLIYVNDDNCD